MKYSFIIVMLCSIVWSTNASQLPLRWHPIHSSQYRKALISGLVNECNTNRYLMTQIQDGANQFAKFDQIFSRSWYPDGISISQYLRAIYYNLQLDGIPNNDGIFVVVAVYMNRLMARSSMKVTYWNVHRILSMSLWMACKMYYDVEFNIIISASDTFGLEIEGIIYIEICS